MVDAGHSEGPQAQACTAGSPVWLTAPKRVLKPLRTDCNQRLTRVWGMSSTSCPGAARAAVRSKAAAEWHSLLISHDTDDRPEAFD